MKFMLFDENGDLVVTRDSPLDDPPLFELVNHGDVYDTYELTDELDDVAWYKRFETDVPWPSA